MLNVSVSESKQFEEDDDHVEEGGQSSQKSPGQWLSGGSFWWGGLLFLPLLNRLGGLCEGEVGAGDCGPPLLANVAVHLLSNWLGS
jgi:hypothetical protein